MRTLLHRCCLSLLVLLAFPLQVSMANEAGPIVVMTINEAIGPSTADYLTRGLSRARDEGAQLVVIRMDTPGGLDTSMREIIKAITSSAVPVASYVAPTGARAASAGTYILYASHIAAMAPGTNLGAATPVQIGGTPSLPAPDKQQDDADKGEGEKPSASPPADAMQKKILNDAIAYIRGLAALHGRNAEWAEKAVREGASLPAREALQMKVVDILADNMGDLLRQIDGRKVKVLGEVRTLHTAGLTVVEIEQDWRSRLLSVITNPNIAYILMLIGIYGLIFEFSNPGAIVPGTVGAICLLLALYSFQLLPINYAGVGLILLGVALMVGEAFEPSFGMLGIGGVIAFVVGSIILIDTDVPGFGIDVSVIATFALISVMVFVVIVGMAIKARRRPVSSGREELIGAEAIALQDFSGKGTVRLHGEIWQAYSPVHVSKGQLLRVTQLKGLELQVEPIEMEMEVRS